MSELFTSHDEGGMSIFKYLIKSISYINTFYGLKFAYLISPDQVKKIFEGDGLMSGLGCLIINQTKDWTSHSKVVIRTGNQDLLNSLLLKTAEMSVNGSVSYTHLTLPTNREV